MEAGGRLEDSTLILRSQNLANGQPITRETREKRIQIVLGLNTVTSVL